MRQLVIAMAIAGLTIGVASAQTAATTPASNGTTMPATSDKAAVAGNDKQAITTTAADSPSPAKGANSFTMGQAATRIADHGFTGVTGLKKDQDGVWRGQASKSGQQVPVWLDYRGNVGQQ